MQFCQNHWNQLKDAIKARGLWGLVAKNGRDAVSRMKSELEHGNDASDDTWDPLMNAHWMIFSEAIQLGGLYLMGRAEDGTEYCPVCEAVKHCSTDREKAERFWIDGPADASLSYAIERHLISPPTDTVRKITPDAA